MSHGIEICGVVTKVISGEGCHCTVSPSPSPAPSLLPVTQVREEDDLIFTSDEKRCLGGTTQKACCLAPAAAVTAQLVCDSQARWLVWAAAAQERRLPRPATPTELLWSKNAQVFA